MRKNYAYLFLRVCSLMLCILAVVFGGGVAIAEGTATSEAPIGGEGPTATKGTDPKDPANPNNNTLHVPGDGTAGETLNGTQMSSTQQRKEKNVEEEWDEGITQFQPWKTPFLSIARSKARRMDISNWEINHARIGGDTLDGKTTQLIASADQIKISPSNFSGSLKAFYKCSTIFAPMVPGYKKDSDTETEGCLMLYVTDFDTATNTATCVAINGPLKNKGTITDEYDCRKVPQIPAGTYLCAGSTVAGESQLVVTPENYQPRYETFYVQKKLLNLVWTKDFEKIKKKIPWHVADVKANAVSNYNLRAERTYMLGTMGRFTVTNADGSIEDAYSTKGVVWQVTNAFSIKRGSISRSNLISISKLQHTTFSQNSHSYAFCGSDFMEWLLNIDMGANRNVIEMGDVKELNIDFKRLKTTFGTTDFTYCQTLDAVGMSECCLVLDLEGATRYVKINEKEQTNDLSKGGGEVRDAKREIHQEADGIALRGYNSIIVGPSDIIFALPEAETRTKIVSAAELPENPAEGTIVALTEDYLKKGTEDDMSDATKYEAGTVWEYKSSQWKEYQGYTSAV